VRELRIDGRRIADDTPCFVIAEIGHNHQGSVERARELVRAAHEAGVDAVKLQKRDNRRLYTRALYDSPYDNENSFGPTYGAHREALELDRDAYVTLRDEATFLEPVFRRAGDPFVLVAHSYGAAVALVAAASLPGRISALALYEPTLFALLDQESPAPNDADRIRQAAALAAAALDAGNPDRAAAYFIDYWMGDGAWERTPEARKPSIAASVSHIRQWESALSTEPTPLSAFAALDIPVLYMTGTESPASSRSVARLLLSVLPNAQHVEFEGLGHMGPVTHADSVNDVICRFIESTVSATNR